MRVSFLDALILFIFLIFLASPPFFLVLIFGYQRLLHSTMYYAVLQYAINVLLCITIALHVSLAAVTASCAF